MSSLPPFHAEPHAEPCTETRADLAAAARPSVGRAHQRRLREVYRSAGWPCLDALEVELLAAGLLERRCDAQGRETLRVTDAGLLQIADAQRRNRAALDAHEALVERVARTMVREGRIAWRALALRAKVSPAEGADPAWCIAMPDVFSVRNTTVEAYLEPVVHEVKVRRADLLADLKRPAKRAAYLQLGGECWYVVRQGIARADEIPPECGVLVATDAALEVARPAPRRAATLPFGVWMALAKATPVEGWLAEEAQDGLRDIGPDGAS